MNIEFKFFLDCSKLGSIASLKLPLMPYLVVPVVYVLDKRRTVTAELNVNFALTAAALIHTLLNNSWFTVYLLLL